MSKTLFPKRFRMAFLWLLALAPAQALQTQKVEIGNGGTYDGTVLIARDAAGRMILSDHEVTVPATLNQLLNNSITHGAMLGLGNDDHPQYYSAQRFVTAHGAVHTASDNSALPISADLNGNTTLGGHAQDDHTHLKWNNAAGRYDLPHNLMIGSAGGGDAGVAINSSDPAKSIEIKTVAGEPSILANGDKLKIASLAGYLGLASAASSPMYFDAGDLFLFRDKDAAGATRVSIDSSNGEISTTGNLKIGGATVIDSARNLTPVNVNASGEYQTGGIKRIGSDGSASLTDLTVAKTYNVTDDPFRIICQNTQSAWNRGVALSMKVGPSEEVGRIQSFWGTTTKLGLGNGAKFIDALSDTHVWDSLNGQTEYMRLNGSRLAVRGDIESSGCLKIRGMTAIDPSCNLAVAAGTLTGNLSVGSGAGRITLNGQKLLNEINLLDNPDFNIWQRNISQSCAAGGDAGGTLTYPVPGTLTTGADRWQVSRAKTDQVCTISQVTPPAALATAQYCLKTEWTAGAASQQYLHQTLPRELTIGLRGKWVTFAITHYLENGSTGGNIAIYKTIGGTPTELIRYTFSSTPNTWERLAVSAQVPTDAETILVSIQSNLVPIGPTVSYLANATLVEGKYVSTPEKVSILSDSSVPPIPKQPALDLANCQRYFEKGSCNYSAYTPDTANYSHYTMVAYNTAKAGNSTITISNLVCSPLISPITGTLEKPAYSAGRAYPQGFRFHVAGTTSSAARFNISADWTACSPEPI